MTARRANAAEPRRSILVGCDLTEPGDDAVRAALALAASVPEATLVVVHVVSQKKLDSLGEVSAEAKRAAAIGQIYPELWRRLRRVLDTSDLVPEPAVDVQLRLAEVHATRSEEKIAHELLQAAVDYGSGLVALGRRGRPGSVAERLLEKGAAADAPAGAPAGTLVVRIDLTAAGLAPSPRWTSER